MKTFYFFFILLSSPSVIWAQVPDSTLEDKIFTVLSELDYSSLQTGIHIDRSPAWVPVELYDGTWSTDSLKSSWNIFHFLYSQLAWAQVNSSAFAPMDSIMNHKMQHLKNQDTTIIGGIWAKYDRFLPWAVDSNLITVDSGICHRVSGAASPFYQQNVFAMALSDDRRDSLVQIVKIDTTWMFNNQSAGWGDLAMDADDGLGWRSTVPGDVLTITYSTEGIKLVKFRMITPSGDTLISGTEWTILGSQNLTQLEIRGFEDEPDEIIKFPLGSFKYFTHFEEYKDKCGEVAYDETHILLPSGLTAFVFLNQNCDVPKLRKPLIILDGFDSGRTYDWSFVLGYEGILNEDYGDLNNKLLSDYFHDSNYDIIFVDWSDATGDIRDNGEYLRQFIHHINAIKHSNGSTEKNVIIGASMGGLIGKWGLLKMQNAEEDSETELFVTFDSPHQGANIPLGMQAMVKDLAYTKVFNIPLKDQNSLINYFLATLDSKGARQMLYYNWTTVASGSATAAQLSEQHDAFYAELNGMGELTVPTVAIANGSIHGLGNSIVPGEILLNEVLDNGVGLFCDEFWDDFTGFLNAVVIKIEMRASPGIGSLVYKKNMFHSSAIFGPPILNTQSAYYALNVIPYDHAPGGLRSFNGYDEEDNEQPGFSFTRKSFCFIPTISALDLNTSDLFYQGIDLEDVDGNVENGVTPFRSYVGTTEYSQNYGENQPNEPHVVFDKQKANLAKTMLIKHELTSSDNPLSTRTFNFGEAPLKTFNYNSSLPLKTGHIIHTNLQVINSGQLWINRLDKIGFTDLTNSPLNGAHPIFDVWIGEDFCTGLATTVTVEDGGLILIGDGNNDLQGRLNIDNGTKLVVDDAGTVILEKGYHNNIVVHEGTMEIKSGGTVDARWGSRILIQEGGILKVRSGGKLFIKQYSSLEVEEGGKLVLEPGAEIYLWDGQDPEGAATIHIHDGGELEWQGDIQFTGNGFFQFDDGNIFTPSTDWNLAGMGREFRMIRLNNNATLKVNGVNMYLSDGGVEFEQASSLDHYSGENRLDDVRFYGASTQTGFGMNDFYPMKVFIDNCHFDNLENGYNVAEYQGVNPDFIIQNSLFEDCVNGLTASPASWISIDQSVFDHCVTGAYFKDVKYAYLNECSILGDPITTDIGVFLEDTPVFRMHGGVMDGLDDGIQSLGGNQSNVFLYSQATISNCDRGIYIQKGGINNNGQDYGMVLLDCANLLNNKEGVIGEDILLQVDAVGNATHHPNQTITPNTFVNGDDPIGFDDIFQICYDVRDAENVMARQNVWGNGAPSNQYDFDNHDFGTGTNGCDLKYNKVDNIIWNPTAQYVVSCPLPPRAPGYVDNGGLTTPPVFGSTETCTIDVGSSSLSLHNQWARGFERFYAEDLEGSEEWLIPVAGVSNNIRESLSNVCRKYIDQARVLSFAIAIVQGLNPAKQSGISNTFKQNSWNEEPNEPGPTDLIISPNPARDAIQILTSETSTLQFRVVNSMGMLMQQGTFRTKEVVNVHTWPEGMYEVQLTDAFGQIINHARFLVTK